MLEVAWFNPASIYLSKVNNENTRTMCEIRSKLIIKIPEQHQSLLLTLNKFYILFWCFHCYFEHVNIS